MRGFIKDNVKFRMGDWYFKEFSPVFCDWNDKNFLKKNDEQKRYEGWVKRWKELGVKNNPGLILCSQDARTINPEKNGTWAYHSRWHNNKNGIIFPLECMLENLFKEKKDFIKWEDKEDDIIWRGKIHGVFPRCYEEQRNKKGAPFKEILSNTLRGKFVFKYNHLNIKFVEEIEKLKLHKRRNALIEDIDFCNKIIGQRVAWQEQLKKKYILNIEGNDYPSSLPQTMKSNSLVLMTEKRWDFAFSMGINPWEHYVPLDYDGNDLEEKLEWCRRNDDECFLISKRATEYINQFSADNEITIEKEIFKKLKCIF